ncbi:MAG: TldD/PmbA family protein [Oscillatoriaceae bacterium SKW80]|nr:TldD/PmbA family protein [Oscillatoriaceae bacterium SKYG93]MCX8119387.1 TldD/PmbA family protein [Oscillatoriaceae bacterium SKW80]MDW8454854.1 TldD/PmbA family protein [Oscillatoriaceae cyanobacterium SKYGB_i_bin93]HIK28367.1 TldD/PmbA family protein [Oscillatoriaceae cyanobacterium M7585_C2015_266]
MTIATAQTIISEEEALSIIESVIKQSAAEGVFVSISAGEENISRFSENQISQNVSKKQLRLTVTSNFGNRQASASTTEINAEAIAETVRRSEELARIAPEDPEWMPLLEPQNYEQRKPGFDAATATLSPLVRGEIVKKVCDRSAKAGVKGCGTFSTEISLQAIGNSLGLRASERTTKADFSFTARLEDGSSWDHRTAISTEELPIEEITEQQIEKALASRHPREISPGTYPVILSGAAFAELLSWVVWNLDARAADEGRSFMSRIDATGSPVGNRLGEQMFSPLVQLQRYPAHPLLQSSTFFSDGLSNYYLEIIKNGIPQTLYYSRYWGKNKGFAPTGILSPIVMIGSDKNLSQLIAETERAILISRAWYVRYVNPRTLEVTGMTRDGTFWIEDGAIAFPIKNLRFNQVLPDMLRDIDALGTPQRFGNNVVPEVRVRAFNFTSLTDSI